MKLLEEFWYGNIEPTEYDTSSKEYKKLQELICRNELCEGGLPGGNRKIRLRGYSGEQRRCIRKHSLYELHGRYLR